MGATFTCTGCSSRYAWSEKLAGKKVRCKCGTVMTAPVSVAPPPKMEAEADDLYALADDLLPKSPPADAQGVMHCPSCRAAVEPGALICLACGLNFQTGKKIHTVVGVDGPGAARPTLAHAGGGAAAITAPNTLAAKTLGYVPKSPRAIEREAENANLELKALTWPIVFVAIGIGLSFFHYMYSYELSLGTAMAAMAISLLIDMVLIFVACIIAIKVMDIGIGTPAEAVLKICAVALIPGAIAGLIGENIPGGFMLAWAVSLGCYFALLKWFFDLDGGEVMILTTIIWLIRTWAGYFIAAALLSAIFGGDPLGGGAGGGGGGGIFAGITGEDEVEEDKSPAGRVNSRAMELLEQEESDEARDWAKESDKHIITTLTREATIKAIDDLYAAGAKGVYVSDVNERAGQTQADKLVVELPSDPTQRKKIIAVHAPIFEKKPVGVPKDLGADQAYLILHFDGSDK